MGLLDCTPGKKEKGPTPEEAIQKLKETEKILIKKQEFLEQKIQQELQMAKKHGTKNKRGNGGEVPTGQAQVGSIRDSSSDAQGVGWVSCPTGFAEEEKIRTAAGTNRWDIIYPGVSA